ncbi:MAG: hypothetical protein FJ146_09690 [Deltaproteobacteria bacterium]|nr:hypothetical protein [Deltaproteobacteria bacterium]
MRVYRDRGAAALASLTAGKIDEGNTWLKRRTAAFHNLRVVETRLATGSIEELADDPEVQELWQDIRQIDSKLQAVISESQSKTAELVRKLQIARQKITCYRSGEPEPSRFEQSA